MTDFNNNSYGTNLSVRSKFDKAPNFEFSAIYNFGRLQSDSFDTDYQNLTANLESNYYLFKDLSSTVTFTSMMYILGLMISKLFLDGIQDLNTKKRIQVLYIP